MAGASFWNIGTEQQPIIQGQAAKPFYHQMGPLLKFQDPEEEVDNKCLCKYRYMRYYAFYAYVSEQPYDSVQVYQDFQLPQSQDQDEIQFRNYDLQNPAPQGYKWAIWEGPVYIGCHPQGSFTCGVWLPVQLPYPSSDSPANTTVPAPSYISQMQDPQRKSLMCMIVCSYKCCNGKKGCGTQIPRINFDIYCTDFPMCYAQYYVTGLSNEDPKKHVATLIKGTQGCICTPPFCIQRKFIQHDCDSATVKAFKQMNLLPGWEVSECQQDCLQCQEQLPETAKSWAKAQGNWTECVQWLLWKWQLPAGCDPCQVSRIQLSLVDNFEGIPAQVVGKGAGWLPKSFHNQQRMDFCNPQGGGTSYQWTYMTKHLQDATPQQVAAAAPKRFPQDPCKDSCKGQQDPEEGKISDSLSGHIGTPDVPNSQKPCNTPDAPPYVYKKFRHRQFTVWYLQMAKIQEGDPSLDNPDINPCYNTYQVAAQSEDPVTKKLNWKKEVTSAYDYQLQTQGWFLGTKFLSLRKDRPNKVFLALPVGEEPPEAPGDERLSHLQFLQDTSGTLVQDTSQNHCKGYYQVYYNTACRCQDPCQKPCPEQKQKIPDIFSSVCAKWRFVGRLSQETLQWLGIKQNDWVQSTVDNTFSTIQKGPIGQYVYTASSQDKFFCDQWPKPPEILITYVRVAVKPVCPNGSDSFTIQVIEQVLQPCEDSQFKQGFKSVDQMDAQPDLVVADATVYPEDACQIYYFKLLKRQIAVQDPEQTQPPSVEQLFPQGLTIQWDLQNCLSRVKKIKYAIFRVQPNGQNTEINLVEGPQIIQTELQQISDQPVWGWVNSADPMQATELVQEPGQINPWTAQDQSNHLCQIYYLHKINQYTGCQMDDYSSQDNMEYPDLQNQNVAWDLSACLQFKLWVKYAYAELQLNCQTSQLPNPGIPQNIQWGTVTRHIVSQDGIQPWLDWKFGWASTGDPQTAQLLPVSGTIVTPKLNGQFLCTVYYIHKLAQYFGTKEQPDFPQDIPTPDLQAYSIAWDLQSCLQNSYHIFIQYAYAQFSPTCSDAGIPPVVNWSFDTISLAAGDTEEPSFGWGDSSDPRQARLYPVHDRVVQPGEDCTVFYTAKLKRGIFCDTPPQDWSAPSQQADQLPDISMYSINWNQVKCLQKGHWVVYKQLTVTPLCEAQQDIYNEVQWGSPVALQLKQGQQVPSQGWLYNGSNVPADGQGIPTIQDQNICQLVYRVLLYDNTHCGPVPSSQYAATQAAVTASQRYRIQRLNIPFSVQCRFSKGAKHYVHYAYMTQQVTCDQPIPSSSEWKVDYIQSTDANADPSTLIKSGWYQGELRNFKDKDPLSLQNNTAYPQGCSATYVHVLEYYTACKKRDIQQVPPSEYPQISFPASCTETQTFIYYKARAVRPSCAFPGGKGQQTSAGFIDSDQQLAQGIYQQLPPTPQGLITEDVMPVCTVYDVRIQKIQACSKQQAQEKAAPVRFQEIYNLSWDQSCPPNPVYTVVCVQLGWQLLCKSAQSATYTWSTGKLPASVFQQNFGEHGAEMNVMHTMYLPSGFGLTGGRVSIQDMQNALAGQSQLQGSCSMNLGKGNFFFYVQVESCDSITPPPRRPQLQEAYLGIKMPNQMYNLPSSAWCLVYTGGEVRQEFINRQDIPVIKATGQSGKTSSLVRQGSAVSQYTVISGDKQKLGKAQIFISDVYCTQGSVRAVGDIIVFPDSLKWGSCHAAELANQSIFNNLNTITLSQQASNIHHIYNDTYQFNNTVAQCDGAVVQRFILKCLPHNASPGTSQYPWMDGTTAFVYVQGAGASRFLISKIYSCQYYSTNAQGNIQYWWESYVGPGQPQPGWCTRHSQGQGQTAQGCTGRTKQEDIYYVWTTCGCDAGLTYLTLWSDDPQHNQGFDIYIQPYQWKYSTTGGAGVCYYPVPGNAEARPATALNFYAEYASANPNYTCLPQLPKPKFQRSGNAPIGVYVRAYWSYSCSADWQFQGSYYISLSQQQANQTHAFGIPPQRKDQYPYIDQFSVKFRYNTKG